MKDHIFRTYDIRGIVGVDLDMAEAPAVMQAVAVYFQQHYPTLRTIAVGRDGRVHSPELYEHVCATLQAAGYDILEVGLCPTPVVHFTLATLPVDAGIMVTASHNGPAWNGLKLIHRDHNIWGQQLRDIYQYYYHGTSPLPRQRGTRYPYDDMVPRYVTWLADHFSALKNDDPGLMIDCGNGATGAVMPELLTALGWQKTKLLYPEVDGTSPHHEADPVVYENMIDLWKELRAKAIPYGIGFDGDGDRMGVILQNGTLIAGDQLLALYAQESAQSDPGRAIVYDMKCSLIVAHSIVKAGGIPIASPSGHALIRSHMRQHRAILGGELSCHFFFADRYFGYDDGIYAALRLIELQQRQQTTLPELLARLPTMHIIPEMRIPCREEEKQAIIHQADRYLASQRVVTSISRQDGLRAEIADGKGWLLIRASNTQPVISVRCEGADEELLAAAVILTEKALLP